MNAESIWKDIVRVRDDAPLIHNITNYVAMNVTANALLAIGASPVMAHAVEEVEDMVAISSTLVINIGTLSKLWVEAMFLAAEAARKKGLRIVFDPVGAGATRYRTETSLRFISEFRPAIVRGNATEIISLIQPRVGTRGVDSRHGSDKAVSEAFELSDAYGCIISVSGAVDRIIFGNKMVKVANGHVLMSRVTGLGCTASALTGAFAAVNPSPFEAAVSAMAVMGIAGEMAAEKAEGPGSFQVRFLDALFGMTEEDIRSRLLISTESR
jgi:hydroxyethylthiazole kinase